MFKFLKKKVKNAITNISDKFEEEAEVVKEEEVKEKEVVEEVIVKEEGKAKPKVEKKGLLSKVKQKVTTKKISARQFDTLFWDLEVELLENNVAFEVIEKIKQDLKKRLVDEPLKRGQVEKIILNSLKKSVEELLVWEEVNIVEKVKSKKEKPYVICFVGTNGSGKTTTIAKLSHLLKEQGLSSVLVASDTFRKAAIEQLETWGKKLDTKVIKHDYNADPSAVAFDGIKFAKQKNLDVVLIDTSGRLHSNKNLMREMEKIIRVSKPDMKILVAESITGNDAVEQAKEFDKTIGIDGVILTKSDVDEKGGTILSMSYVSRKPILYLGVGQEPEDLKYPEQEEIMKNLGL